MIKTRGFTLIEVLVSMVILAIGLLGLAALQGISLRDNQDAYYYQQATLLAYEMQDRIRGNGVYWSSVTASLPSQPTTEPTPVCSGSGSTVCTATQMAIHDYWNWKNNATSVLPAPDSGNMIEVSATSIANTNCSALTGSAICLITRWARTNNKSSKLTNTSTFYLKVTP